MTLPGPTLAGAADTAAGLDRGYAGVSDDELIGVLTAWQRTESWAAAGRLSAAAELARRRPATSKDHATRGGEPRPVGILRRRGRRRPFGVAAPRRKPPPSPMTWPPAFL